MAQRHDITAVYFRAWSLVHGVNADKFGYVPIAKAAAKEEKALAGTMEEDMPMADTPLEPAPSTPAFGKKRGRHKYMDSLAATTVRDV